MKIKIIKTAGVILASSILAVTGLIPSSLTGAVPVVQAKVTNVQPANYDGNYSVTHGTGLTFNADGTTKLGTIANGDKALFKKVDLGDDGTVNSISFTYSKPNTDNVKVTIYLDKEKGTKLGEWTLNKKTKDYVTSVTQEFTTGFNKTNVSGKHNLYLAFSCNPLNNAAVEIYSFTLTSGSDKSSKEQKAIDTRNWQDKYINKSNKNKPWYSPNMYNRTSYVVVSSYLHYNDNSLIFGDPYAIKGYNSAIKKLPGISYNYKTNTLTLSNCNYPDSYIACRNMGKSFKIKLVGKNNLQALYVEGGNWPTPLHLTGSGSLILNKKRTFMYGPGLVTAVLHLDGWFKESFTIDKNTKVTAYGNGKDSPVVLSYGEGRPSLKKAVKISFSSKKKKLSGKFVSGKTGDIKSEYEYNKKNFVKN